MTKLTAESFEAFIKSGATTLKAVLFYGQDEGLVEECRERAAKAVVSDLRDPFRVVQLTPSQIRDDPALLQSEADAISLMGGRRVIMIRGADNLFTSVLKSFLPDYKSDALIIVTAGALKAKDSLPLLFEKTAGAGVLPCYADEGAGVKKLVVQTLAEAGLTASGDVVSFIADNLGANRLLSRSELAKLVTYMGDSKMVRMEDAAACIGDASALSIDEMLYALTGGDQKILHETLDRLFAEGEAPIMLLRAAAAHLRKFHTALGKVEDGKTVSEAVGALFLHFKRVEQFKSQMRLWSTAKIGRALDLLVQTERACKKAGIPQNLMVARVFLQIAAQAKK